MGGFGAAGSTRRARRGRSPSRKFMEPAISVPRSRRAGHHPGNAQDYLDPTLQSFLPDPYCLKDMEAAAKRIAGAIERGETVAVFGDYDVDGAAASALLYDYFQACGTPCLIHIPDRIFEGYGPNVEAIRNLARDGAKLLGHGGLRDDEPCAAR